MIQGGTTANLNGNELEQFVINILKRKEFEYVKPNLFLNSIDTAEQKIFSYQVYIGDTIYNTSRKCDLIVFNPNWKDKHHKGIKIIECKW